jgi:tetratricopeptide (TPR) repeat protein
VLARGLDPDPAKRYSTLEDLLDALERAAKLPVRRRGFLFAAFGILMAGVLLAGLTNKKKRAPDDCDHPERLFEGTYTHGQLAGRSGDAIDQFGKRWVDAYTQACRGAPEAKPARTACLQGALDDVAALTLMLRQASPDRTEQFDTSSLLPNLRACEAASPLAPVLVPRTEPARSRAMIVLAKLLMLRATPTPQLATTLADLEQEALAAGGGQFAGTVLVSGGNEYLHRGEPQKARDLFTRFLKATPRNQRLEAVTRMSLVDVSVNELAEPHAKVPPDVLDPRGKPMLHPELTNLLAAARSATSSDDTLAGIVALLDARARMHLGQWNRYRRAYSDALEAATLARRRFDAIGDVRRSAVALTTMAEIYLERGDESALDDAQFALRQAGDALDVANLDTHEVDRLRAHVAFLRRDYGEAHRRYDAIGKIQPMIDETVSGRVVGAAGKTVTVVAWHGELAGDRTRIYTDPHFLGDIVQAADDGTFTVHARPDWAIIAETKGMRSKPILVGKSPVLALVATTTVSGSATGHNLLGVSAFARYTVGDSHLSLRAAIDRDDRFDLVGLPPGAMQLGLIGPAGTGERIIRNDDAWPSGQAIEAILRGHADALVYVLRGTVNPKTIGEVEKLAHDAADVASCMPSTIGADNTDAGREVYRAGDYHCVITGNATGPATVCAGNAERLTCKPLDIEPTVEVSYPDGRYAAGVTPVVLEL